MDVSKPTTVVDLDEDAIELNDDEDLKMETNFTDVETSAMSSTNFVIQNEEMKSETDQALESDDKIKAEIKLKIDSKLEELKAMQMTQLKEKEAALKDKFEKLSTKIINSYPKYKQWLETNKKTFGSPICEIDGSTIPPPDQLKLPRWKIIFKKYGPHAIKEIPIDEKTVKKELIWIARSSITEDKMELFPEHVKKAIDLIKEFLQEQFPPYVIAPVGKEEPAAIEEESTDGEKKNNPKRIRYDLNLDSEDTKNQNDHNFENFNAVIKTNRKKELLVQLFIKNITPELIEKLKLMDCEHKGCKIKSLLLKKPPGKEKLETESIVVKGAETIDEYLLDIKIPVSSSFSNNTNLSNYVVLAKTIRKYLLPNRKRTLLGVGCGILGLMMANSSKKVYCIDLPQEIEAIKKYCDYNQLTNVTCLSGTASEILSKLREEKIDGTVLALLDTNNQLSRDPALISGFRKIPDLFRVVVMSKLAKPAIRTLLDLMEPGEKADEIGFPLMPKKACVVDLNPKASFFETIITFERKSLKIVATSNDPVSVPVKKNLPQMQPRNNFGGPKNNLMGLKNTQTFKPNKNNNQAFRANMTNNVRGGFGGPRRPDNPKFQQMMQGAQFNKNNAFRMGNQGFNDFGNQQQKMQQFKMKQTMGNRPNAAPYQKNRQNNFPNQQNQSNQFNKNPRNQLGSGNSQDTWNKNRMQNMGLNQGNSWGGMSMNNLRAGNRNNFGGSMQGNFNQSNMTQNTPRIKNNSMGMDMDGRNLSDNYESSNQGMFGGQGQMGGRNMQQMGGNQWFDKKNQHQSNWKTPMKMEEHFYNDELPENANDPWDNEDNQPMQPKNNRQNLPMQQQRNMMNPGQKKMGFNSGSNDVLPAKTFSIPPQRNQAMSSSTSTNSSQFNFPFQRRPNKNWGGQQSNVQSNNQTNVGAQSNFNQNRFQQQNFFNNRNNRQQFNMPQ